jgi:hypothetical protein
MMSTPSFDEVSPRLQAQMAGALYALTVAGAVVASVVDRCLVVLSDPATTAANIIAHQPLFRLGFLSDLVSSVSYLAVAALLYSFFHGVSRAVSVLVILFSIVASLAGALSSLFHAAPLVVLKSAEYLSILNVAEMQSLALIFFKWRGEAYSVSLLFFGLNCVLIAYLVTRTLVLTRSSNRH